MHMDCHFSQPAELPNNPAKLIIKYTIPVNTGLIFKEMTFLRLFHALTQFFSYAAKRPADDIPNTAENAGCASKRVYFACTRASLPDPLPLCL